MKFATILSAGLLSFAKLIAADSEEFYLLTIRSGSVLQYASVVNEDGTLYFGSGTTLQGVITDAGLLKTVNDTFISVETDGSLSVGDESSATSGFSIVNGYLSYDGSDGFYGVPQGSEYLVSVVSSDSALGVGISARSSSGSVVPDFSGSSSSSSSGSNITSIVSTGSSSLANTTSIEPSTAFSSSTVTKAPITNSTSTVFSSSETTVLSTLTTCTGASCNTTSTSNSTSNSTSSSTSSSANGADKLGVGIGAGVLAAVALLV